MGEPALPPVPPQWLVRCEMKSLPAEPDMEADCGIWIESLSAWIAADEEERDELLAMLGRDAKILLPADLPPTP